MNMRIINLVLSVIFATTTIAMFYWLWTLTGTVSTEFAVAENLKPIEIESIKKEANTLLEGLSKVSDMPIPTPTEKMGKTNPFQ